VRDKALAQDRKITKTQELVYEMQVDQVMTRDVVTVRPETPMSCLREVFRERRISGAPVVENDRLVGIISLEDFIKWLYAREENSVVQTKMTTDVDILFGDEPLVHAVSRFAESGFGRFAVVDRASGELVGVITKGDIVEGLLRKLEIDYHEEEVHSYRARVRLEDVLAVGTTLCVEYEVEGQNFDRGGESSSRLKHTLKGLGLAPDTVRRVAIATYEAEMNLVVFTDGGTIAVWIERGRITVEVTDSGPGIPDVEKALQPGFSTAPQWVRDLGFGAGMGLNNIRNCSDDLSIDSAPGKGTRLTIKFLMEGDGEAG
jgi:CBS domain-containing protein